MHTSLAAQLAQLKLGHLAIDRTERTATTDLPESEAVEQTLAAIWSDLFALFPDTALEEDAEEIAWGLVNLFHRAVDQGLISRPDALSYLTSQIRNSINSGQGRCRPRRSGSSTRPL